MKRITLPVATVLCAALVWAQAPTPGPSQDKSVSISKVERKNKAPVSKEILQPKLPRPLEVTLDNGLTVLIMEDRRFPTVNVSLNISGAGGLFEPANLTGLASVTAQMLREGTKTRNSQALSEEVDRLGATLFANSSFNSSATTINASGLSDNLDQWFALVTDILLNPSFPASELSKLTQRLKVQVRQQRSQPGFLANERFSLAVYGAHPAGRVSYTNESLDALTSEALAKWHAERYAPQNAILGIAGDVRAAELVPKLKTWLAAWKKTDLKEVMPANPVPATAKKIYLVDRPNSVQTTITMGNIALDRRHPDHVAMEVLNRIFGQGPAARLFLNLREEKGYTYGVYSGFTALKYPGPFRAGGDLRTEVTDGAMTEFLKEINRIRDEKVPAPELDDARRALIAGFALTLEQSAQVLGYAVLKKIYGFPDDFWDTYPAKIAAVTADDIQRVARKYLNPDALQIVAVGEGSKIKAILEKYGPVEVFDMEGKAAAKAAAAKASD